MNFNKSNHSRTIWNREFISETYRHFNMCINTCIKSFSSVFVGAERGWWKIRKNIKIGIELYRALARKHTISLD